MTILRDAAKILGISRTTLEKWCKRLGIEPQRHEWDWRFYTITDEEVERIRAVRSQMPERVARPRHGVIPSYSSLAFDRRATADSEAETSTPLLAPLAPTPRPRVPRAASTESRNERRGRGEATNDLPDGMMSITEAERLHGIPASNIRHWTNQGIIETDPGTYHGEHGRFEINRPLTRRGLAQFYTKAVEWERAKPGRSFTRCPDCPHKVEDTESSQDA